MYFKRDASSTKKAVPKRYSIPRDPFFFKKRAPFAPKAAKPIKNSGALTIVGCTILMINFSRLNAVGRKAEGKSAACQAK